MTKRILSYVILSVAVMCISAKAQMPGIPSDNSLVVIMEGEAKAKPDICKIVFSVEKSGESMAANYEELQKNISKGKTALEALAFPEAKTEVSGVQLSTAAGDLTQMFGSLGGEKSKDFSIKSAIVFQFSIKGMEPEEIIKKVESAIKEADDSGLALSKFGFGASDKDGLEKLALDDAVKKADAEANILAAASGKKLAGASSYMIIDLSNLMGGMFQGMGGAMKNLMGTMFSFNDLSDDPSSTTLKRTLQVTYKTK